MTSSFRTSPALHVFTVTLHPGHSARDRKRYFRRMQRDLSHRGLILNYCIPQAGPALCLAVKDRDAHWPTDRHIYVTWTIDQQQTHDVIVLPPPPLQQLVADGDGVLSKMVLATLQENQIGDWPLARVVGGLVTRAIYHLRAK